MSAEVRRTVRCGGMGDTLAALAVGEGSAGHPHVAAFTQAHERGMLRDLCDVVHHLCMLHGRHPGVVDHAAERDPSGAAGDWLGETLSGFARERTYLTRLVVVAGPLPSTPRQAESDAAVIGQHHALTMLAKSDRTGCAMGAAMALVLDWKPIRTVLDAAAWRLGIDAPRCELPDEASTRLLADRLGSGPAVERAMQFGAQQLLVQHRGLWDLLEARRLARAD